jgi:hypothetical protein
MLLLEAHPSFLPIGPLAERLEELTARLDSLFVRLD